MQLAFSPYSSPEPEGISDVLLAKHRYELILYLKEKRTSTDYRR